MKNRDIFTYILIKNDELVEVHSYYNISYAKKTLHIVRELNQSSDCFYNGWYKTRIPNIRYIKGEDYSVQTNGSKLIRELTRSSINYNCDIVMYKVSFLNRDKVVSLKQRDVEKITNIALNNNYKVKFIKHE